MTFIGVFWLNDTDTSITLKHPLVWSLITIYQACSLMVISLYHNYYYYYYYDVDSEGLKFSCNKHSNVFLQFLL